MMSGSRTEELSRKVGRWIRRGGGWDTYDFRVRLEPPFQPFFRTLHTGILTDDGHKPRLAARLAGGFKRVFGGNNEGEINPLPEESDADPPPVPFESSSGIRELVVSLPSDQTVSASYAEQLLLNLCSCAEPLSFEVIGTTDSIAIQFACREPDVLHLQQQIQAHFPEVTLRERGNSLMSVRDSPKETVVIDVGLGEEFTRPIRTLDKFDPDPLAGIYGALESLGSGEVGLLQVMFECACKDWSSSIMRAVTDGEGGSFFSDAPEMLPLAREKVSRPLFAVVTRILAQADLKDRAWEIGKSLVGGLTPLGRLESNELIPLNNRSYGVEAHIADLITRCTRRTGMLLNSQELVGLVHLPSSSVRSSKLRLQERRTRAAPKEVLGHLMILGENIHRDVRMNVSLSTEQRLRHIHIIGKTGMGKSTLLINSVRQDCEAGRGVAVLDPHGDLIDRIVELIPQNRIDDVILFDPSDTQYPIGFNVLQARSEIEKTVLSSDLSDIFRRFSTSWGDQMTTVLSNAISAILESNTGGTLFELKRFLLEKDFRDCVLARGVDPLIVYFWQKEYPLLRGASQISISTRLDAFLRSKIVRNIVTQREGLDFTDIVERGKVLLVKLPQGMIGEENAYLLGSLICSKLHQVVMGRQAVDVKERKPFFCYLDEFQHFATPSMASMLSGSRKYNFGLTLVHQDLQQIADTGLTNSVITNPAARICFALGDNDAQKLQSGFAHFDANDLMNLGVGEAIVRVERSDCDFNLRTYAAPSVTQRAAATLRERIVALTRERYARAVPTAETAMPPMEREETPSTRHIGKQVLPIPVGGHARVEAKTTPISPPQKVPVLSEGSAGQRNLSQHRYLQTLIKKMAGQRGYRAVIEDPTPDGNGRVDVGLERDGKRIAVEFSVTTGDSWEYHNIEKCLRAGYNPVIVCSPEKKNLESIRKLAAAKLPSGDLNKVLFFEPEELFRFLDEETPTVSEKRVKGYRVNVQYEPISENEKRQKRKALVQTMMNSMRILKR